MNDDNAQNVWRIFLGNQLLSTWFLRPSFNPIIHSICSFHEALLKIKVTKRVQWLFQHWTNTEIISKHRDKKIIHLGSVLLPFLCKVEVMISIMKRLLRCWINFGNYPACHTLHFVPSYATLRLAFAGAPRE